MKETGSGSLVDRMLAAVEGIPAISDHGNPYRKQLCDLARRIGLLAPMLEEIKDGADPVSDEASAVLSPLEAALDLAREVLRFGSRGSKIRLVLEREKITRGFHEVTTQLEQALNEISFEKLNISDEVREQVELVHSQFKRAKGRVDARDDELFSDLSTAYNASGGVAVDPAILKRLAEKLQLTTISDLEKESLALHEPTVSIGGVDPGENIEKMSMMLTEIKAFVQTQNPAMGTPANRRVIPCDKKMKVPRIPDDFRCPISLDLMRNPVIVATGHTYERDCIEKWIEAGHNTCPKTRQKLPNTSLTPNYVLRSLIVQWCIANGIDPPEKPLCSSKPCLSGEHPKVVGLIRRLSSHDLEDRCSAAWELRLLAKRSSQNRVCIAKAGAVPLFVGLLSTPDVRTQEHAVTALLNLSICEENKGLIVSSGAIPGIVHVLKKGSMETRENAAATLFSLSVVDENKVTIGASGAIPALASLLGEGSQRGKKDAATALFNLCIYQGNKGKVVRSGVIPTLMKLLTEAGGRMVDEALAILGILSSHSEAKVVIGGLDVVPVLVEIIGSGSPRNRENAAAILIHLSSGEQQQHYLAEAQGLGVMAPLQELAVNGTDRGRRKAAQLIERINDFLEKQKEAEARGTGASIISAISMSVSASFSE